MQTLTTTSTTSADELMFLGARCRVVADATTAGGRYGLVDMVEVPPCDMPPLHVHRAHDEGFLLLEGELTLFLPDRQVRLEPGQFLLAPRGVPHCYRVGEQPARWLVVSSPAGFEEFVRDVAALADPSPEALAAVGARRDIEILAPPGSRP